MTDNLDNLFEQMASASKAYGYDILAKQVGELKASNKELTELLDLVVGSFVLESCEKFELLEKIKIAVRKGKILSF